MNHAQSKQMHVIAVLCGIIGETRPVANHGHECGVAIDPAISTVRIASAAATFGCEIQSYVHRDEPLAAETVLRDPCQIGWHRLDWRGIKAHIPPGEVTHMATAFPASAPGRSFVDTVLLMAETFFTKGADYFREMSVLIVVFIPLELWRHAQITTLGVFQVLAASGGLYLIGMACEWTSYGVRHGRQAWQEESLQ